MRESFVFYRSFFDAICELDDKKRLKMYDYIAKFALKNEEPEEINGICKQLFVLIKPQILANNVKMEQYQKDVENGKKGAEYGKLGGRPKKHKQEEKTPPGFSKNNPLENPINENVNVNDNVNENVNENENVNVNAEKEKFNLFFNKYPKQVDEYKTFTLFDTIINEKIVDFDELMKGVERYKEYTARSGTDEKFIKSPYNWLKDMSWKNDYERKEAKNETPYRYNAFAN